MRRLMYLAACVLFLVVPLWAQHGGGGHAGGGHGGGGFGGHAGFSGGHGGGLSGGHISGGTHSGPIHSSPGVSRGFAHGPTFAQRGFGQRGRSNGPFLHNEFRGHRGRGFGFRNGCYGYGCRYYYYPYAYGGYYDPYWWWDSGSGYYDDDYERNLAEANEMNQQSLQDQYEQEQMMRQEEADGDQDTYARSSPVPRAPETESPVPATVLVFRDQHRQEVRNYAIVGQTIWNFGPRTEKIPLADLDLAATTKANDERGLTFRVPASSEAQ